MNKGFLSLVLACLGVSSFLCLIMYISANSDTEAKHRHKIEQLQKDSDLAGQYAYVSELKYCIRNVKFTDSLLIEVDKMLDDKTVCYDHQRQLLDIREDLEISRIMSNIEVLLDKVKHQ